MCYPEWGLNFSPLQLTSQVTEPLMDKQQVTFFTSWSVPSIQYCNVQVRHNLILSILDNNRNCFRPGFCWMYMGVPFHTQAVQAQVQNRVHRGLSYVVFNKKHFEFYRYILSPTQVIFSMVVSSSSTNHLNFNL